MCTPNNHIDRNPHVLLFQFAYLLSQYQYFVCPVEYNSETNRFAVECDPSNLFVMQEYTLPAVVQNVIRWVSIVQANSVYSQKKGKETTGGWIICNKDHFCNLFVCVGW